MSGLSVRSSTAGHDDIRDTDRQSILRAAWRSESDGLIGIEVLPLGFITFWHLALYPSAEAREFSFYAVTVNRHAARLFRRPK